MKTAGEYEAGTAEVNIIYRRSTLCPNNCRVDRSAGQDGCCAEPDYMRIAFAGLHLGEEPCISFTEGGYRGSGTIFFSGCPLGCSTCQNVQLSRDHMGAEVSQEDFVSMCLKLEQAKAANLNLVTASHVIPSVRNGLISARNRGFSLPVVWNTSSFESPAGLGLIDPFVDIYLADIKLIGQNYSVKFFGSQAYSAHIVSTVDYMTEHHPLQWDGRRLTGGTVIRHLVLPNQLQSTREVLQLYAERWKDKALLSLMVQYIEMKGTPQHTAGSVTERQYDELIELLDSLDIQEGFIQELGDEVPWIPDFRRKNPFPQTFAVPMWHWSCGFL